MIVAGGVAAVECFQYLAIVPNSPDFLLQFDRFVVSACVVERSRVSVQATIECGAVSSAVRKVRSASSNRLAIRKP